MQKRRFIGVVGLAVAAIVAFPTSAGAFECSTRPTRSAPAQGNQSAAKSAALQSFSEILADPEIVGLCPEGVDFVIAGLEEAGFRTDVLINFPDPNGQRPREDSPGEVAGRLRRRPPLRGVLRHGRSAYRNGL